jgi:hypothetical protein
LAAVVAFAIVHDPNGFSLQKWQTLGSAIVALGAATLAYKAAMKTRTADISILHPYAK